MGEETMRRTGYPRRRDLSVGGLDPIAPGSPHGLLTSIWGVRLRAFSLGALAGAMIHVVGRLL